jgi:DNA-binding GntR family transcriptional regulator
MTVKSDDLYAWRAQLEQLAAELVIPGKTPEVAKRLDAMADEFFERYLDVLGEETRAAAK